MPVNRRKIFMGALAVFPLVTGSSAALAQAAAPKVIRATYVSAEKTAIGEGMRRFAMEVEEASKGRLKVEMFPFNGNGTLSDAKGSAIPAMLAGKVDVVFDSTTSVPGQTGVKELEIWDMPFLFRNTAEADKVLDGAAGKRALEPLAGKGIKAFGYGEIGFKILYNNLRPITRVEDLRGLKIRVIPNPIYQNMFKALGAQPVPMGFDKLYDALKKGEVDGMELPPSVFLDSRLYEVQKYASNIEYIYLPMIALGSMKWYDGLSAEEKGIVDGAMKRALAYQREVNRQDNTGALQALKNRGVQINQISRLQVRRFEEKLMKVSAEIVKDAGLSLFTQVNQELVNMRAGK